MAKKKPKPDNEPLADPKTQDEIVKYESVEQARGSTFQDQVAQVLKLQEERQSRIEKQVSQLVTVVTNLTQQKDVEKEKPKNPMDYLEAFNNLMNGPIGSLINKLIESVGTAEPTPPPMPEAASASMVTPEQVKRVNDYNDQMAKYQMEMASEMVRSIRVKNDMMEKESRAEF